MVGVWTLYDAYATEGGVAEAAKVYGVDEADVRLAVCYVDSLLTAGDVVIFRHHGNWHTKAKQTQPSTKKSQQSLELKDPPDSPAS